MNALHIVRTHSASLLAAGLVASLVPIGASLSAQAAPDARFQPWMGCWSAVAADNAAPGDSVARPTRACVVPSERISGSVDVALYAGEKLLSRTAIPKPGVPSPRSIDDCSGTESAEFVANDTRLVLHADLTCSRGIKRVETGLMSIAPNGEWLQLQHQQVAGNVATTVARLRFDADRTTQNPAFTGVPVSSSALRIAVGGTVTSLQVLAVAKTVPVGLAEAYVAELGLQFPMSGKALAELADAGMPPRVIDLMVAMAHPESFQVGSGRPAVGNSAVDPNAPVIAAAMREPAARRSSRCSVIDDFCYGPGGMGAWGFGWGYGYALDPWGYPMMMSRFGARYPYGVGYGLGYGAWPYGYGYGYPGVYYGNTPIIIVNRPTNPGNGDTGGNNGGNYTPTARGRAVNGGGYTRTSPSGGTGGSGTARTVYPSSGSGGSGGGAAPSGGSSGGGGDAGRTAKPRGGGH